MRILFVELLGGLGDVLIAIGAMQALARTHQTAITVLTFAPGGFLLQHDPFVDRVIYAEKGKAREAVENLLHCESFDLIVSDTSYDAIDKLIASSDAERVVTNLWRSPPANQFVSDRFLQILIAESLIVPDAVQPAKLYLTEQERQTAQNQLGKLNHPIVLLCPDAGMQIKRWSEGNFIEVGQKLQQQYNGSIVVPVGSDANQVESIVKQIGGNTKIWQSGTLRELAAMFSHADLMIAADTGPARIAAAVGVPTITLFGPSWAERYGQPNPHINLQGYPACPERKIENFTVQSCWYSGDCPVAPQLREALNAEWATCVDAISVDRVMAAIAQLLEAQNIL